VQKCASQSQPLALALGQHAGKAAQQRAEFQPFDRAVASLLECASMQAAQATMRLQMFQDRQFRPMRGTFRQPADELPGELRRF